MFELIAVKVGLSAAAMLAGQLVVRWRDAAAGSGSGTWTDDGRDGRAPRFDPAARHSPGDYTPGVLHP